MALKKIFTKTLSKTDASKRMAFPTKKLALLPPFSGGNRAVHLLIEDETGRIHTVCCTIRLQKHKKPVLSSGWPELVRVLDLKEKDEVTFFKLGEGHLKIQVMKKANGDKSPKNRNINAGADDEDDHKPHKPAAAKQEKNITAIVHCAGSGYRFEYEHVDGEEEKKPIKLFGFVIGYGSDHRATS